jgi:hypothetical protein
MIVTKQILTQLSISILFYHYYLRSKIYIFLWVAILNIILLTSNLLTITERNTKLIVAVYVVVVIFVYILKNNITVIEQEKSNYIYKLNNIKHHNKKMLLPFMLWLIFYISVNILFAIQR